jgi:hypothetical protein
VAVIGAKMTTDDDRAKRTIYNIEEKLKKFQELTKKGGGSAGQISALQKQQIAQSATQMGKLIEQLEAVSPGFLEVIKGRIPDYKK